MTSSQPTGRPDARETPSASVVRESELHDVRTMAAAAAEAGDSLDTVFDDLRAVCDLEEGVALPTHLLRAAALAWAEVHRSTRPVRPRGEVLRPRPTPQERLWWLFTTESEPPDLAIVVTYEPPHDVELLAKDAALESLVRRLLGVFSLASDHVATITDTRLVVLTRSDRIYERQAQLAEVLHDIEPRPRVQMHTLVGPEDAIHCLGT